MAEETGRYEGRDELRRIGKLLITQLFVFFKTSMNYPEGHAAIETSAANVLKVVREIVRRNEEAALRVKWEHFHLGELRLKLDSSCFEAGKSVMEEMTRHLVGGISFHPAVTLDELKRFVYVLRAVDALGGPDPHAVILELMERRGIVNIEVETLPDESETAELTRSLQRKPPNAKLSAGLLYRKALSVMGEVTAQAGAGQALRFREPKRIVQHMIDLLTGNEPSLLGLTASPCREAGAQNHAVNVAILSLVMGRRLGMTKFQLSELGMAALFHDIGKVDLPGEVLEEPDGLSPQQRELFEAHPVYGVRKMMKFKGLDKMNSRIVTGVFEHHLLADFTGYPRLHYRRLSLLGRIICVADGYEALTSARGGRAPYTPDKALRFMLTRAGKAYDTGLLKLFVSCVGIYGIGSLLLLDSKELAVVVENQPARPDHPRIKVIADARGREVEREATDLAPPGTTRAILAVLDPHPFNLDVSRYFG